MNIILYKKGRSLFRYNIARFTHSTYIECGQEALNYWSPAGLRQLTVKWIPVRVWCESLILYIYMCVCVCVFETVYSAHMALVMKIWIMINKGYITNIWYHNHLSFRLSVCLVYAMNIISFLFMPSYYLQVCYHEDTMKMLIMMRNKYVSATARRYFACLYLWIISDYAFVKFHEEI